MVTDQQVRILMNELRNGVPLYRSAARSGMSVKTARKWSRSSQAPSEPSTTRSWRTRLDPFESVSDDIHCLLTQEPDLQATALLAHLQSLHSEQFHDGHLRSLQRRLKVWKTTEGPPKEVFFAQVHHPGDLAESDFCHLTRLGITLAGQPFAHLLYHFVLTYSNWETGMICFSESFESLSDGLQAALKTLGGVPKRHRTDSLRAAVVNFGNRAEFNARYTALGAHYALHLEHTQPRRPNENGDVEQSHHRFIQRLEQSLKLRGSRDFADRQEYAAFVQQNFDRANLSRTARFSEEQAQLMPLPAYPLDGAKQLDVRVSPGSTIRVQDNVYSVPSRLIGSRVNVRVTSDAVEVSYAQRMVHRMPRLRGKGGQCIDYRHIIDWLVRKPGAFDQYVYHDALFPSSHFRIAYDALTHTQPVQGQKQYLQILHLAARCSESRVEDALRLLQKSGEPLSVDRVAGLVESYAALPSPTEVHINPVVLDLYDTLLTAPMPTGISGGHLAVEPSVAQDAEVHYV